MNTNMRILGIDPGFDRIGWALATPHAQTILIEDARCLTPPRSTQIEERFAWILRECSRLILEQKPTVAAIETIYFSKNVKTAIQVAEARGVIMAALLAHNIAIKHYNPSQVKLAVAGSGNANKTSMAKMLGYQVKLPNTKLLDDALDAIALCLTHQLLSRHA